LGGNVVFDSQLQRPGQLHLHRHRRQRRQRQPRSPGGQPVNDKPVAVNDITSTPINVPLVIPLRCWPTTAMVDATLSVTAPASILPGHGQHQPTAPWPSRQRNVTGPVVISYSISDGAGGS
jgi:hypothetical protein